MREREGRGEECEREEGRKERREGKERLCERGEKEIGEGLIR